METKHKWIKEIANSFHMTVGIFAETLGYSRQTIYQASSGYVKLSDWKVKAFVSKLTYISDKILENDLEYANKQHETRKKLIKDLEKRFLEGVK